MTTLSFILPTVVTSPVTSITPYTAIGGGNVTNDGGSPVTARGVCWSTAENPTISNNFTSDSSGTGSFTSEISGLNCASPYFVRAYATNSEGISYGSSVNFNSGECPVDPPTVITASVTDFTDISATVGGNVTAEGGSAVTETGVYWGTSSNPRASGTKLSIGTGSGEFSTTLTGLSPSTPYYIIAYAVNSSGEAFGDEETFTTTDGTPSLLETEAAINDTLQSCYSRLHDYIELAYLFDAVYSNHIQAPDGSWTEIYNHTQTQSSNNAKILDLWSDAYDIIFSVNLILESSGVILSVIDRQAVTAQAKAIRAYLWYNLLTWFGGIPLETGLLESMIPRNTAEEVLAQIERDVNDASQSLPMIWSASEKFKIPKIKYLII